MTRDRTSTPIMSAVRRMHDEDDGRDPRNHSPRARGIADPYAFRPAQYQIDTAARLLAGSTLTLEK